MSSLLSFHYSQGMFHTLFLEEKITIKHAKVAELTFSEGLGNKVSTFRNFINVKQKVGIVIKFLQTLKYYDSHEVDPFKGPLAAVLHDHDRHQRVRAPCPRDWLRLEIRPQLHVPW
jgi:hypothetical protein